MERISSSSPSTGLARGVDLIYALLAQSQRLEDTAKVFIDEDSATSEVAAGA